MNLEKFGQCAIVSDIAIARDLVNLKQLALLYDHILFLKTEHYRYDPRAESCPYDGYKWEEIYWLEAQALATVVEYEDDVRFVESNPEYGGYLEAARAAYCEVLLGAGSENHFRGVSNAVTRGAACRVGDKHSTYVPFTFSNDLDVFEGGGLVYSPSRTQEVLSVVLNFVPQPSELTPWEEVLEFREQQEYSVMAWFRKWIRDLSKSDANGRELEDNMFLEVEKATKLSDLHKREVQLARTEILVTTVAAVPEKLLKLQWGEAAKTFCGLGRERLTLLRQEQEVSAVGPHYLVRAKDAFARDPVFAGRAAAEKTI